MLHFQRLDVYRCAIEYLALAHGIRGRLGRGQAELSDQLRCASQSIVQNIAEGAGRVTKADKGRHFAIARGSAMECVAHLDVMRVEELIEAAAHDGAMDKLERVVAMLTKMIEL